MPSPFCELWGAPVLLAARSLLPPSCVRVPAAPGALSPHRAGLRAETVRLWGGLPAGEGWLFVSVSLGGLRTASVVCRGWFAGQTHQPGDSCLASELPKCSPGSMLGTWEVLECCFQNFPQLLGGRNCSCLSSCGICGEPVWVDGCHLCR